MKYKFVRVAEEPNKKLDELAEVRKKEGNPVSSKQGIIAELIFKAHKREVK